ncbi:ATP-binding cassette domain-containing protein [Gordonia hydrophobica]|uniref:ATP-binding cassette domain-containing protein n=1 Tax=Gordonia hydrophobica TaxID=40516 RepID=A0ABZ2U592_9ACTN|nr:ATP-binding cassette domain-containing protein [Gordonia hydrophobica]MBM7369486.1 iron complex transport system ATP-binding protein [Gordonia hydrophobica]
MAFYGGIEGTADSDHPGGLMTCVTSSGLTWRVDNVHWNVGATEILRGVTASGEPGEITALLGPNGSGKTTLLSVLAGVRRPTSGTVTVIEPGGAQRDLHGIRTRERAKLLALVEQHAQTETVLTVRQVVELGRIPHRQRGVPFHLHSVIDEAMEIAEVSAISDRSWATLSGGERQRTQLARALAQQPSLLLLDEPTNHLDLHHQIDFLTRIRSLGLSTVAALHDLELAAAFCDRAVVLDRGEVVASGSVDKVITPDLLDRVYGVDGDVEPHPRVDRPHVRWTGLTTSTRKVLI